MDFTQQCKTLAATTNNIALVKTVDLFAVVKYLDENEDERFKQACRQAIFDGRGKQVKFPEIRHGKARGTWYSKPDHHP